MSLKKVLIYRHQLFKPSEPFILEQAKSYSRFEAVFVGREYSGSAIKQPQNFVLKNTWERIYYTLSGNASIFKKSIDNRKIFPALIHAHFGFEGVYALPLSKALGVPLVTTFHGVDVTTSKPNLLCSGKISWLRYLLFRRSLIRDGALFICVSDFIRQRALSAGFPPDKTITLYIGVDTQKIQPIHNPTESNIVLHVARLVEKKGTQYLLDAFARVVDPKSDTRLVIIGDGPLRASLEEQTTSLGISNQVLFLGALPHEKVLNWMHKSRLLVLPSITSHTGDSEGLGIALLESAAAGLPVIGTQHGGIPEAIVDGCSGFLVPERNVTLLANRLSVLLRDNHQCVMMGQAARRRVVEKFDIQEQTKKLESLYSSLL